MALLAGIPVPCFPTAAFIIFRCVHSLLEGHGFVFDFPVG